MKKSFLVLFLLIPEGEILFLLSFLPTWRSEVTGHIQTSSHTALFKVELMDKLTVHSVLYLYCDGLSTVDGTIFRSVDIFYYIVNGNEPWCFLMPDDIYTTAPPPPPLHFSSLIQLLTIILVSRGEIPLADGVVGGESLSGNGVVSGDGHGQDAGVGDHTARGRLATVPANVGTHWGRKRRGKRGKKGIQEEWRIGNEEENMVEGRGEEEDGRPGEKVGKMEAQKRSEETKGVRDGAGEVKKEEKRQLHHSSTAECFLYSLCPFLPLLSWEMLRDFGQKTQKLGTCFLIKSVIFFLHRTQDIKKSPI